MELSVETQPSAVPAGGEAGVAGLGRPHAFGEEGTGQWGRDGGLGVSRLAPHAAAPESVLVLSFKNQVRLFVKLVGTFLQAGSGK